MTYDYDLRLTIYGLRLMICDLRLLRLRTQDLRRTQDPRVTTYNLGLTNRIPTTYDLQLRTSNLGLTTYDVGPTPYDLRLRT